MPLKHRWRFPMISCIALRDSSEHLLVLSAVSKPFVVGILAAGNGRKVAVRCVLFVSHSAAEPRSELSGIGRQNLAHEFRARVGWHCDILRSSVAPDISCVRRR